MPKKNSRIILKKYREIYYYNIHTVMLHTVSLQKLKLITSYFNHITYDQLAKIFERWHTHKLNETIKILS